jgi:hypothetical protein
MSINGGVNRELRQTANGVPYPPITYLPKWPQSTVNTVQYVRYLVRTSNKIDYHATSSYDESCTRYSYAIPKLTVLDTLHQTRQNNSDNERQLQRP